MAGQINHNRLFERSPWYKPTWITTVQVFFAVGNPHVNNLRRKN